ncbi:hypothetical protein DFH06DRAFT_1133341 [Mycena polygramma]|nr:hypothetical protein DFH06DRAFT_1133341 [Mycena polygramma]
MIVPRLIARWTARWKWGLGNKSARWQCLVGNCSTVETPWWAPLRAKPGCRENHTSRTLSEGAVREERKKKTGLRVHEKNENCYAQFGMKLRIASVLRNGAESDRAKGRGDFGCQQADCWLQTKVYPWEKVAECTKRRPKAVQIQYVTRRRNHFIKNVHKPFHFSTCHPSTIIQLSSGRHNGSIATVWNTSDVNEAFKNTIFEFVPSLTKTRKSTPQRGGHIFVYRRRRERLQGHKPCTMLHARPIGLIYWPARSSNFRGHLRAVTSLVSQTVYPLYPLSPTLGGVLSLSLPATIEITFGIRPNIATSHSCFLTVIMARTARKAKGRHSTKIQDPSEMEETRCRAAKRREISRRYYERCVSLPSGTTLRGLKTFLEASRDPGEKPSEDEREKSVKLYRRQWDPPKEARVTASDGGDDVSTNYGAAQSDERSTSPATAVAHAALTTMYRMSTILHGARVPLSLAEIEDIESSGSEASDASPTAEVVERRTRLAALKATQNARISAAAAMNGRPEAVADAWIDRERAARMKIHVETSPPVEVVHEYRASAGVENWLRHLSAE